MKYLFLVLIISNLCFSIKDGIYYSDNWHENGQICKQVKDNLKNEEFCKESVKQQIYFLEEDPDIIFIYNDYNNDKIYLILRDKKINKAKKILLLSVGKNYYKSEESLKLMGDYIGIDEMGNSVIGKKEVEFNVLIHNNKEKIKSFIFDNSAYSQRNYKWNKNITAEQEKVILKFLEYGTLNWDQLGV